MGYYVSVMIGIRTGGVFSGKPNLKDMEERIKNLQKKLDIECYFDTKYAMTESHHMFKGDYVLLAGVSNGFSWNKVETFSLELSKEFGTEVMAMTWDEQTNKIDYNVYLDGKSINEVNEHPISQSLRRIAS